MWYRVEWKETNPTNGFHYRGRAFPTLLEATNFFHSLGNCCADLLFYREFYGYYVVYSK